MLRTKRVYDPASPEDGVRVLIDRLWPRGLTKEAARVDRWMKELAPSAELRRWFGHDPEKFPEFRRRYLAELRSQPEALRSVSELASKGTVTLLYGARDGRHCNATVLHELLGEHR